MFEVVNNDTNRRMTISFSHIPTSLTCKFTGLRDKAEVTVDYIPDRNLIEAVSLRNWIMEGFGKMSNENLVELIYNSIWNLVNPKYLKVKLTDVEAENAKGAQVIIPWSLEIDSGKM